jgi:hypothetical protein
MQTITHALSTPLSRSDAVSRHKPQLGRFRTDRHNQRHGCPPHEECYGGILFGLKTFAISLPILFWLFIFLAIRSRGKQVDAFGAARSDRPDANGD